MFMLSYLEIKLPELGEQGQRGKPVESFSYNHHGALVPFAKRACFDAT